ncbi:phosphotransferase family protein [Rhodococcus sp. BP-252]|uniref:phosphotransferase family protein n=1 Tax=unclassified Rhodococcus (in: high G+C Gram-positive bacteria) TaxID=192944 RepID=UPI00142F9D16|nr:MULTISPECIES: phosphotransferase family protein [unclassified Rhodococcus (in: high G+C Gram-positive bacteria)]MBY6412179.1 phosphotransferase family protein [Rhodococcus sp. BP-320]MBY6416759.1 phosphotransferase family protein [Rhodococcus sp. BP-321]MBY6421052.1 phosphotransferase family protein [Rhodococcus sp. BP-324]MBY6426783.1 phosphotransferase family protein [Rhodococcus sp. BP-323]MBY6431782.1 phosphotransferase family protein [Rhodococcus sp. BP-322]
MTESTLESRVAATLAERGVTVADFETLPGGHSGLTYRAHTSDGDIVVKAVPDGQRSIGRHDMLRQAAILTALTDTDVPVPRIVAIDRTEPSWFAMELVQGESLEPVLDDPAVDPAVAARRMLRAAEVLPRLHAVDLGTVPGAEDPLSPSDELDRWARTLGAVPPELVAGGDNLLNLLRADIPDPIDPVLVHGDYRLGNILSDGDDPAALIDWEIWSVGDPRVELGWFLLFADGTNFPGVGREVPGLPSPDDLISAYTGHGRQLPDMTWFDALGRLKMAAIMGHNLRRHREGRHIDPDQEKLPATIDRLIETGTALLRR